MHKDNLNSKLVFLIVIVFILFKVFDGLLRFIFAINDVELLIYLPTILMFSYIFLNYVYYGLTGFSKRNLFLLLLLITYLLYSILNIGKIEQSLFGLYIFINLLFGISIYRVFYENFATYKYYFLLFLMIAILGVILQDYIEYPWVGFNYMIGDVEINASRDWTSLGEIRRAGFSRASFDAAIQIAILSIFSIILIQSRIIKVIIFTLTLYAIILTTTKGVMIAYTLTIFILFLQNYLPKIMLKLIPFFMAIVITIIPLYSIVSEIKFEYSEKNNISSFKDRIENTWPDAFLLVSNAQELLVGKGIGGIGVSQSKYEKVYNPADNMVIYILVSFGLIGVFLFYYLMYQIRYIITIKNTNKACLFIYYSLLLILIYGVSTNIFESSFLSFFLGLSIGFALNKEKIKQT